MASNVSSTFQTNSIHGNLAQDFVRKIRASAARRRLNKSMQCDHDLFTELIYDIQHELDVDKLCFKILHNIAVLTNCDRSSLFLTRKQHKEPSLICKFFDLRSGSNYEEVRQQDDSFLVIPFGTGILGHVAEKNEFVKIDDAYQVTPQYNHSNGLAERLIQVVKGMWGKGDEQAPGSTVNEFNTVIIHMGNFYTDSRFNSAIDQQTGYKTNSVLCMPITDTDNNVVGVAQIINKTGVDLENPAGHIFNEQDVLVFRKYLMFCGIGITNAQLYQLSLKEYRCNQLLLTLAGSIFKESTSMENLISQIMISCQEIVNCSSCRVFLCDEADGRKIATEFVLEEGQVASSPVSRGDNLSTYTKIANYVCKTGQTFIAKDEDEMRQNARSVEIETDDELKSMLCTPIRNADKTMVAVGQMVNKQNGAFSSTDISVFEGFVIFCGLGISNTQLYEKTQRLSNFQHVCLETLSYHAMAHKDEWVIYVGQRLASDKGDSLLTNRFSCSDWMEADLVLGVIHMMERLKLLNVYSIDHETLLRWICSVRKNYRNVEFHNWRHAFSVTQAMFWLIMQEEIDIRLTTLEKFVLIASCMCHDVDHRGTNNAFQVKSKSPLAKLHNSSTLEHHHFNMAVLILNTAGNNVFESLAEDEQERALSLLKSCILATDLAQHFRNRNDWNSLTSDDAHNIDWSNETNKIILLSMLMTAADLGASTKPWDIQLETAASIAEEFYQQGDLEKNQLQSEPILMMDRDHHDKLPSNQVSFFDTISIPLYTSLCNVFPSTTPLLTLCVQNRANWAHLAQGMELGETELMEVGSERTAVCGSNRSSFSQELEIYPGIVPHVKLTASVVAPTADGLRSPYRVGRTQSDLKFLKPSVKQSDCKCIIC